MASITDVININQRGRYGHSSNTRSIIKALSNESILLQDAINYGHSIQQSKKILKNKNEKFIEK